MVIEIVDEYRYFIAYLAGGDGRFGAGHALIKQPKPIETYEDIEEIERELAKDMLGLTIINWKRLQ